MLLPKFSICLFDEFPEKQNIFFALAMGTAEGVGEMKFLEAGKRVAVFFRLKEGG